MTTHNTLRFAPLKDAIRALVPVTWIQTHDAFSWVQALATPSVTRHMTPHVWVPKGIVPIDQYPTAFTTGYVEAHTALKDFLGASPPSRGPRLVFIPYPNRTPELITVTRQIAAHTGINNRITDQFMLIFLDPGSPPPELEMCIGLKAIDRGATHEEICELITNILKQYPSTTDKTPDIEVVANVLLGLTHRQIEDALSRMIVLSRRTGHNGDRFDVDILKIIRSSMPRAY